MKKQLILLTMLLWMLCGCQKKKETEKVIENNGMLEIREDMPIKVTYSRQWIYAAQKESSDPELIMKLLQEIRDIKIGETTNVGVMDYTDIVIFEYEDGEKMSYRFEADVYVKNSEERYAVIDGLQYLRETLDYMISQK
ncbi:MAG: hypothetical protein IKF80_01850 [Erysipelotrichaceae bacterium]|nr:hypothetical protein [Erysipelotrichaceae bacterium]